MTDPTEPGEEQLVPEQIDCIDCGGRSFRLTHPPEDGVWEPGEVVAYRCEDCLDRWDLVVPGGEDEAALDDDW